ncbi:hypothetical protein B0E37_05947 [Streptomyces sp. MH192]|nr:hypothetical protein [Streptomyces sp. MH192]MCF0103304.1 hypothetical protein [Streptomyces sp. MH191]
MAPTAGNDPVAPTVGKDPVPSTAGKDPVPPVFDWIPPPPVTGKDPVPSTAGNEPVPSTAAKAEAVPPVVVYAPDGAPCPGASSCTGDAHEGDCCWVCARAGDALSSAARAPPVRCDSRPRAVASLRCVASFEVRGDR